MTSHPGSTTIAPSSPVRHQTQGPDTEQKDLPTGTKLGEEQIPYLSLNHYI